MLTKDVFSSRCNIDAEAEQVIVFVHSYAPDIVEWKILKKELLMNFSSKYRGSLSRKDRATNKMNFNDFEKAIIEYWQNLTGTKLYLNES